jgi:Domain of unknown function (DUF4276)
VKQVFVIAEGQTEEVFLTRVIQPHLHDLNIWLVPILLTTKVVRSGPNFRGGVNSWKQILTNVKNCCAATHIHGITTMLDYYALPTDTPLRANVVGNAAQHAVEIQQAMAEAVRDVRFRAYLSLHEFEALLFAGPDVCGDYLNDKKLREAMRLAVQNCGSPEEVNDSPATAPSKRILQIRPTYKKSSDGPTIAGKIGVEELRSACPHFGNWLTWLESL